MSENKHTPGEWKVGGYDAATDQINIVTDEWFVAGAIGGFTDGGGMQKASARLIAAAPDLLDALRTAKETIRAWHGPNAWEIYDRSSPEMQVINDAISKATGSEE